MQKRRLGWDATRTAPFSVHMHNSGAAHADA